jgi:hypothetical protein
MGEVTNASLMVVVASKPRKRVCVLHMGEEDRASLRMDVQRMHNKRACALHMEVEQANASLREGVRKGRLERDSVVRMEAGKKSVNNIMGNNVKRMHRREE